MRSVHLALLSTMALGCSQSTLDAPVLDSAPGSGGIAITTVDGSVGSGGGGAVGDDARSDANGGRDDTDGILVSVDLGSFGGVGDGAEFGGSAGNIDSPSLGGSGGAPVVQTGGTSGSTETKPALGGSGGDGNGGSGGAGTGGNGDNGGNGGGSGGTSVPGTAGSAMLNVDRSLVNLGTLEIGAMGVGTVTVTNTGPGPSGTMVITASAGLTTAGCSGPLAAGASCTITITLVPTIAGAFSGAVAISANPGTVTGLQISVVASVGTSTLFWVTPTSIDLGNVVVGLAYQKQTITITARGDIMDLFVTVSGADVAIDKPATTCTTALDANSSCTVVLSFVAVAPGQKLDSVIISAGGAAGKTVTIPISAVAQNPAKLVISPSSAQSFVATAGTSSTAITFAVANAGDLPTGLIAATLAGADATDFTVASNNCLVLSALAGCTLSVAFESGTSETQANRQASLIVTDTGDGASMVSVPLTGTVVPPAVFSISMVNEDLGAVAVGATGPSATITVRNTGDTTSAPLAVSVSSPEFVLSNDTCTGIALAKDALCTVDITLKPTSAGAKIATFFVTSSSTETTAKTVSGTGVSVSAALAE
jgi:hypothetical protein